MPPDPTLAALADVQRNRPARVPPVRTVPPTPGVDPPDYYRGQTFTAPQVERIAGDLGISYDEARLGGMERGGRVIDGEGVPSASMPGEATRGMLPASSVVPSGGTRGHAAGPVGAKSAGGRLSGPGTPDPVLAALADVQ